MPDPHDLALMKLGRGDQTDIDAVVELHALVGLDCPTLVDRYVSEMDDVLGSQWKHDNAFIAAIEEMFGQESAKEAEQKILASRVAYPP